MNQSRHIRRHRLVTLLVYCMTLAVGALGGGLALSTEPAAGALSTWTPVYDHDFPDPSVLVVGSTYVAYSTQQVKTGFSIPGATSPDGLTWTTASSDFMPRMATWATYGNTWAPTVAVNNEGTYVMYYSATDISNGLECIGRATASQPDGPFVDHSSAPVFCQASLGGDIDPSFFTAKNGQSYLDFKSNGNALGQVTTLWSVALDPSLEPEATPSQLLTDDEPWQQGIIEGPAMVMNGSEYLLFYSGGGFASNGYAIGYAVCSSPLGPCQDLSVVPVLASSPGMSGPGGPDFFTGPSGKLVMAFAAWPGAIGDNNGGIRAMYMADVTFPDNIPAFQPTNGYQPATEGYWEVGADGGVYSFGNAAFYGSTGGLHLNRPIVGMTATPDGQGYWMVASDGGIFAFGDAQFYGSMGGRSLNKPIVGMTATPDGQGYWMVASDGGIFAFGDAQFYGSMGGRTLARPVTGMADDPATGGYWMVASDGGIFAFNAPFDGSAGGLTLAAPVVSMATTADGGGYWMVGSDGGMFAYGDATFVGSPVGHAASLPIVGLTPTPHGNGYWLASAVGEVDNFGLAYNYGSMFSQPLNALIVAIVGT